MIVADQAINADPLSSAWLGDQRSWPSIGTDQPQEAIPNLLRALELDPANATALSFLAETYTDIGAVDRAYEAAEAALELEPTNYNVQRNYGYVMQVAYGDFESATEAYERALQLAPTQAYIAINLAKLYRFQGDYDTEIKLLYDLVNNNPRKMRTAYYELGHALWLDMGLYEEARETLELCTSVAPNNVYCLSDLGYLQRRDGDFNLCARSYDRAIESGSTDPLDYYLGATCYIVIDDCTRAVDILWEGLELADTTETQTDIRDAMAQCQVVITAVPEPTSTPEESTLLDELQTVEP